MTIFLIYYFKFLEAEIYQLNLKNLYLNQYYMLYLTKSPLIHKELNLLM